MIDVQEVSHVVLYMQQQGITVQQLLHSNLMALDHFTIWTNKNNPCMRAGHLAVLVLMSEEKFSRNSCLNKYSEINSGYCLCMKGLLISWWPLGTINCTFIAVSSSIQGVSWGESKPLENSICSYMNCIFTRLFPALQRITSPVAQCVARRAPMQQCVRWLVRTPCSS